MKKHRAARISRIDEIAVRISHDDNAIGSIITAVTAFTSLSFIETFMEHSPRHLAWHAKLPRSGI